MTPESNVVVTAFESPKETPLQADALTQSCFNTLVASITADDYEQFASIADGTFRKAMTPTAFHSFSRSLGPRLQGGCTPTYLGQLQQKGVGVSLWRVAFADGGDDLLARLTMSKERITGFIMTSAFR